MMEFMKISIFMFIGFCVARSQNAAPSTCRACLDAHTCTPPDCYCCRDELQLPMTIKDIPQIVFFTFDDALTDQVAGFYDQLFDTTRKNPNGCPISMTMFISHNNTKYHQVNKFYKKGMEIAAHSVTHHQMTEGNFFTEAKLQKQNLASLGGIPERDIVGWRSPFLKPVGDLQPDKLKELGYLYDSTLTFSKRSLENKAPTPFTLDFGWPYTCQVKPCPHREHLGFWEVPIVSLIDYKHKYDCVYVDGCMNAPPDEQSAYKFLTDNFNSYYTKSRVPFGINMHPSWFYYPDRLKAMDKFIQELTKRKDVYIVSIKQMIAWLKDPVALSHAHAFKPWSCSGGSSSISNNSPVSSVKKVNPSHVQTLHNWQQKFTESGRLNQATRFGTQRNNPVNQWNGRINNGVIRVPASRTWVSQTRRQNSRNRNRPVKVAPPTISSIVNFNPDRSNAIRQNNVQPQPTQQTWPVQQPTQRTWTADRSTQRTWEVAQPTQNSWTAKQATQNSWLVEQPNQRSWTAEQPRPTQRAWTVEQPTATQRSWTVEQPSQITWNNNNNNGGSPQSAPPIKLNNGNSPPFWHRSPQANTRVSSNNAVDRSTWWNNQKRLDSKVFRMASVVTTTQSAAGVASFEQQQLTLLKQQEQEHLLQQQLEQQRLQQQQLERERQLEQQRIAEEQRLREEQERQRQLQLERERQEQLALQESLRREAERRKRIREERLLQQRQARLQQQQQQQQQQQRQRQNLIPSRTTENNGSSTRRAIEIWQRFVKFLTGRV